MNRPNKTSSDIDQLRENARQTSIFGETERRPQTLDFGHLKTLLSRDHRVPEEAVDEALTHVRANLHKLGLNDPNPDLVLQWTFDLLRERGFVVDESPLELSLRDVEANIFHPVGLGAGAHQNPEATSQYIAQRIKTQFAQKRVYQEDVISAHNDGRLELMHLGAIDRPHDVFLTPEYLKLSGLPPTGGGPSAGPAKHADVLLAHIIRFTHELQNHFAGDIRWGYTNTLLLPFLDPMDDDELGQFVQQLFFEFAQLGIERGSLFRKVILDFDLDLPRQLAALPATGPGGLPTGKTYVDYGKTLTRFNEMTLTLLERGDLRGVPFHAPTIYYHLNHPDHPGDGVRQRLFATSCRWGNPSIAYSYYERDFGALGRLSLKDPDFLQVLQTPSRLRGFSSSSLAINLPALAHDSGDRDFIAKLHDVLDIAVSAHRQKRLFISRLMAYGARGPLQFLRHKREDRPFLKIDAAAQPMQIIGLAEAAALLNGSPVIEPAALARSADRILDILHQTLKERNRIHKLNMYLAGAQSETVAYRFAYLDLKRFGQSYAPYVLRHADQAHPVYTEGANILAFQNVDWRTRIAIESGLHKHFADHALTLFLKSDTIEDSLFHQRLFQETKGASVHRLQMAPDLIQCLSCGSVFSNAERCPQCGSTLLTPFGYCQTNFSPVNTWCLGKRAEWKIRHRVDEHHRAVQTQLPW